MDREVYDRFVKQYKLLNAPDKIDGYVHNDLKTVETDMTSGTQLYPPQASNSPKKGKKVKKGNRNFATNEAKVELTGSCKRCNANNHTAENCPSENLEALRGRCYICADADHRANQCPKDKTKLVCKRCLLGGHVTECCRVKWLFIPKSQHGDGAITGVAQPPQPSGNFVTTVNQKKESESASAKSNLCVTENSQVGEAKAEESEEIYECETKAVSWLNLKKGMIYAKFKVFCDNPYETVDMCGLLDTGANLSIIDNHTVDEMLRKKAGRIVKLPQPLTCTMADGTKQVLTHAWHCMVQQLTKVDDGVGKLVQSAREAKFIILKTVTKDKILIGRDQFEEFGFVIGKMLNCHDDKTCLLKDPSQLNQAVVEDPHRLVVHCDHGPLVSLESAEKNELNATKVYEAKSYEGRVASLEWRSSQRPPRSFKPAMKRAKRLEFSLRRRGGQELVDAYTDQFKQWLDSGFIRPVKNDEVKHYLFHHPVIRVGHPTTPVRPVINGQSLDPFLRETECDMLRIVDIITQWRQSEKWVTMDLSKAFLRIQMREEDQPYLGIYWGDASYVFNVLPFGLAMSPSWLTANVKEVLRRASEDPHFVGKVLPYMDDLLLLVKDGVDIQVQQRLLVARCVEDGFPVATSKTVFHYQDEIAMILGVPWYGAKSDTIGVSFKQPVNSPTTRRELLSMTSSLYDPLGLIIELDMQGKYLVRKASQYDWDTELPEELCNLANEWLLLVKNAVSNTKIPRKVDCKKLLVYVDASQDTWGVDIRTLQGVRVCTKGGLFPPQKREKWTIPRKELLSLVYGRDLLLNVWKTMDDNVKAQCEALILSDSQINCYRVHKEDQAQDMKAWERKTVASVRGFMMNHSVTLRHVATTWNAADGITRGSFPNKVTDEMIQATADWWQTYDFTLQAPWGTSVDFKFEELKDEGIVERSTEESVDQKAESDNLIAKLTLETTSGSLDIRIRKHRDLLRRIWRWKAKALKKNYQEPTLEEAWLSLLLWKQSSSNEISMIKEVLSDNAEAVSEVKANTIRKWKQSYEVDKVTNLLHRRVRQDISGKVRRQIVIPNNDELVALLMKKYHEDRAHGGISSTWQATVKVVWWKGIRKNVRDYVMSCQICQLVRGRKCHPQNPGWIHNIPKPWYLVGIDITGPYTESEAGYKYLLTMTCLYSRYVVAKPLKDIIADTVIEVLMNTFKLLGTPYLILSDNGAQFTSRKFEAMCHKFSIEHKLTPRYSPFLGGAYERTHQTLHRLLISMLLEDAVTAEVDGVMALREDWVKKLDDALFVLNSRNLQADSEENMVTPFELMFARPLRETTNAVLEKLNDAKPFDPLRGAEPLKEKVNTPTVKELAKASKKNRLQLTKKFEKTWEDMREKSRQESIRVSSKLPKQVICEGDRVWISKPKQHKLDIPWQGPYRVQRVQGVSVIVNVNGKMVTDSIAHVLKVVSPQESEFASKKGKSLIMVNTLVWFGNNEAGLIIDGRGNDHILHMVKIQQESVDEYEVLLLFWDESKGLVRGFPLSDPNGAEGNESRFKPLLRNRSFCPQSRGKEWTILNANRKTGRLTLRSVLTLKKWLKSPTTQYRQGARSPFCACVQIETGDAAVNCVSIENVDLADNNLQSVVCLSPMLSKVSNKESGWQSTKKADGKPSKQLVGQLFKAIVDNSIKKGWISIVEHYSYYFENTEDGKAKIKKLFECGFMTETNDNQCNEAAINNKYKKEEEYLPAAVQQLRRKGLDGTLNSKSVGENGNNYTVNTLMWDPSVIACILVIVMGWNLTVKEAVEVFLGGCNGICDRQCFLCTPWVKVFKDGTQLATTSVCVDDNSVNHCDNEDHIYKCFMLRVSSQSFLGILQSMVEGSRWTMELPYETWNTTGSTIIGPTGKRSKPLSEGIYSISLKSLSCLICTDATKTPASDWQLLDHWAGGYGSKKTTQHSYYLFRAFDEINYVGSRSDTKYCYLEGRSPLISNKNVTQSPMWISTWKRCEEENVTDTILCVRLIKSDILIVFNNILEEVCGIPVVDIKNFKVNSKEEVEYEPVNIGTISNLVGSNSPKDDGAKSWVNLSPAKSSSSSVDKLMNQFEEVNEKIDKLTRMVLNLSQQRDQQQEGYREKPYRKSWHSEGWRNYNSSPNKRW